MTEREIEQAEKDAQDDAKELALLLLLLFRQRRGLQAAKGKQITYDTSTARFRVNGRAVSVRSIRMYLARIQERLSRRLLKLTADLENRKISLAQWQREFERTITSVHILAAALALGSIRAATRNPGVIARIEEQIDFADKFVGEIRQSMFTGTESAGAKSAPKVRFRGLSVARIKARAKSYMRAAHITFVNTELELIKTFGLRDEARNRLTPAEHCSDNKAHVDRHGVAQPARPGCPELTAKGWMPVEQMVPIGERTCKQWCKCWIEYR